jgi:phosphomannomutase
MSALMVSVSGVRGIVGASLTPGVALEFAHAYGTLLGGGKAVLARDTRPSGAMFESAALAGLLAAGCQVTQLGVVMTPTVGRTIREGGFAGGVSITASHNPSEWNGIKFFDELGVAPDPEKARAIAGLRGTPALRTCATGAAIVQTDQRAGERHATAVVKAVEVDLAPIRGLKVVLDCVNGAGCLHTPAFLGLLGCEVRGLNTTPSGEFAHPPEPTQANLTQLCDAVRESGAALGLAQDPDADRLALVDERGGYIGEEYTLALATWSVLSRRPGPTAANLSTSRMVDDLAAKFGVSVVRTPVGEAHVARGMQAHGCVIGGEGNGGVIDPRICFVRDSLSAISLVLQLMAATGKSLSALVSELPRYAMVKEKFEADRERIDRAVAAATQRFAEHKPNTADGVRIDLPEGWVHLRASNTEPIVRVMAEARSPDEARGLVERVRAAAGL